MARRVIVLPDGRKFHVGGRAVPSPFARRRKFSRVAEALALPPPPASRYWASNSPALPQLENADGNDTLGDCVEAACAHQIALWRGNAGNGAAPPTAPEAVQFYSETSGYVLGDPATDQGSDPITVFNYWETLGFPTSGAPSMIEAYVSVDAADQIEVEQAIDLMVGAQFSINLPDAYLPGPDFANEFVWGVAGPPNPANGHQPMVAGYGAPGLRVWTWGYVGWMTWAAVARYLVPSAGGEFYAAFSVDFVNNSTGLAPNGATAWELLSNLKGL
jgi:hypothetical protein